ncbi:MAG: hypothetical protein ACE5EY_07330 [Anaerolineae bacterium]
MTKLLSKLKWLLPLLALLLAACGSNNAGSAAPAAPVDTEILSASGKPQLVEFYADW